MFARHAAILINGHFAPHPAVLTILWSPRIVMSCLFKLQACANSERYRRESRRTLGGKNREVEGLMRQVAAYWQIEERARAAESCLVNPKYTFAQCFSKKIRLLSLSAQ